MDELQRKHLIDRLDIVINEVRTELDREPDYDTIADDLKDEIAYLENQLEKEEDARRDAESENDDLKDTIKQLRSILEDLASEDAGFDYVKERVQEALDLI